VRIRSKCRSTDGASGPCFSAAGRTWRSSPIATTLPSAVQTEEQGSVFLAAATSDSGCRLRPSAGAYLVALEDWIFRIAVQVDEVCIAELQCRRPELR
jgi:hypothetical protein